MNRSVNHRRMTTGLQDYKTIREVKTQIFFGVWVPEIKKVQMHFSKREHGHLTWRQYSKHKNLCRPNYARTSSSPKLRINNKNQIPNCVNLEIQQFPTLSLNKHHNHLSTTRIFIRTGGSSAFFFIFVRRISVKKIGWHLRQKHQKSYIPQRR